MPRPSELWSAERLRFTAVSAALIVVAFVLTAVARNLFLAAHRPLGWAVASAGLALLLDPVVRWLSRWVKRGVAILLTIVVLAVLSLTVAAAVFTEVGTQVDRLEQALPVAASQLEEDERIGSVARDFGLRDRVETFVDRLGDRVSRRSALQDAAGEVPVYLVNGILVIFLLVYGPRFRAGFLRQLSDDDQRRRCDRIASEGVQLARRYVLAMVAQAVAVAVVTGLVVRALGVPAPAALGTLVGVMSFVPFVGVLFGSIPALLLSAGFRPGIVTAALAACFVLLQITSSVLVQHRIHRWTLRVGPAVTVIAAVVGFEVYGIGGALHGTLVAILLVAMLEAATDEASPTAPAPTT